MKYCPKCGEQNPDDAKFCGKCGEPLTMAATTTSYSSYSTPGTPQYEPVSSGMKTGMIIVSVLIPIVGIIMGIIYMNDPNPSKKEAGKIWLYVGGGVMVVSCLFVMLGRMG